jgi:N-acetylmuramoyl-L-alanine amidase
MRTIYLSAGHSTNPSRDRGAVGSGYIEGIETARIRKRVAQICRQKYGLKVIEDADDSILSETINYFRRLVTPECIAIDFHFNAATPQATGTETFVDNNANQLECQLAYALSHVAHVELKIPKRGRFNGFTGVKPERESARGSLGFFRFTANQVLPEVCFISNPNDMRTYENNFERYCSGVAITLWYFAHKKESELMAKIL